MSPTTIAVRSFLAGLVVVLTLTCGGSMTDSSGENSKFDLAVSASTLNLPLAQSRTVTLTVTRTNFTAPIKLIAEFPNGQPSGITATFNPATLSGTTLSSTLTVTAAPDADAGQYFIQLSATGGQGAGGPDDYGPIVAPLTVTSFGPQVNVTRAGSGTGTVTSTPAGITCGNTCFAPFKVLPVTLTETPGNNSTFAGWSGGCVGTATTCTFTPQAGGNNAVTATFNSTLPAFSAVITPTSISIPQGGSGTARVNITRVNGFNGPVNLAVSGAPAGLTITANPASVTGDTATLTIAPALSVGVGNYPITITATGSGVAQRTLPLGVLVTAAPGGSSNVAISFAACDPIKVPIWFAYQNGSGPWTRVMPGANNSFTFSVVGSTGIAFVTQEGSGFTTQVYFADASEMGAIASGNVCTVDAQPGSKRLTGTVQNVGTQNATVTIGAADTTVSSPAPPSGGLPFTLSDVPAGTRDLIAAREVVNANGTTGLQKLIVRRGTNYGNNASIPTLDFGGAEAFGPVNRPISLGNLAGDQSFITESLLTANGLSGAFFESPGAFAPVVGVDFVPSVAVPDSLLHSGDYHAITILAAPPGNNPTSFRLILRLLHTGVSDTVTFGPRAAVPTVTSLGTTPYLRLRTELPFQTAYNAAASAEFSQDYNRVDILATAAYAGGSPAMWRIDIPDLSSAGYNATWGMRGGVGVDWEIGAFGGNFLPFAGGAPVHGALITGGVTVNASPAIFSRPVRSQRFRWP